MTDNLPEKRNLVPAQNELATMQTVARNAASSGLYTGVGSEQKILMILLAARELGVPPMQALNGGIYNIQGKIEISARLMNSMIRRAGHSIVIKQCDSKACVMEGKRIDNGDTFTSQFSMEDAVKAGLANRDNWKKYTEDMLYSRCMSRLARRLFPDVIGTAYVEGEIRGELIEADAETVEPSGDNLEEVLQKLKDFVESFPEEDHELIKSYFQKYTDHFKKTIPESLLDYADRSKFEADFGKWKAKQTSAQSQQAA